jgi:hypothetical protein
VGFNYSSCPVAKRGKEPDSPLGLLSSIGESLRDRMEWRAKQLEQGHPKQGIPATSASHPPQRTMVVSYVMTNLTPERKPHTNGFTSSS